MRGVRSRGKGDKSERHDDRYPRQDNNRRGYRSDDRRLRLPRRLSVVRAEPEVRQPERDAGQGRRARAAQPPSVASAFLRDWRAVRTPA